MEDLNKEIKNKKVFYGERNRTIIFTAVACIVLVTVFLISVLVSKNKKPANPIAPVAPKEKSMEDLQKEFSTPVNPDIKSVPISDDFVKSLSVPVSNSSSTGSKTKATIKPTIEPTWSPVSEDFLKNLSVPAAK